ncbi:conserved protein, unknown function [Hepatocystis sp. ex Piliocolobus tephrosceles]|nr:conserved protein, unknown function [Hepatocystis sp. ex Piliocolobus tephrosceles]
MGKDKHKKNQSEVPSKDNGKSSNSLKNYTGVATIVLYPNKKLKIREKYYGNFLQGKKHGYGSYEHGKKSGIGTYFFSENRQKNKKRNIRKEKKRSSDSADNQSKNSKDSEEDDNNIESSTKEDNSETDDENGTTDEESNINKTGDNKKEKKEFEKNEERINDENDYTSTEQEGDTENKELMKKKKKKLKKLLKLMKCMDKTTPKKKKIIEITKERNFYYYGNYSNGLKHNEGLMSYENGDIYVGNWKFGKKNGWGRYIYKKCNSILEGQWKDGNLCYGKWILPNGVYFIGNFKNNIPTGDGIWVFNDKTQLNVSYFLIDKEPKHSLKKDDEITKHKKTLSYKPLYITSIKS